MNLQLDGALRGCDRTTSRTSNRLFQVKLLRLRFRSFMIYELCHAKTISRDGHVNLATMRRWSLSKASAVVVNRCIITGVITALITILKKL